MKVTDEAIEKTTIRAVTLNILPLLMVGQLLMNMDRSGIGFVALDLNKELGLSPAQFGFVAGVFFWGYFLFEIPSNFALQKFGASKWITRILVTWGLVTVAFATASSFKMLAVLRFLLGLAEAGFSPGMFLLCSRWLPERYRGRAVSKLILMSAAASVLGGPLAALFLHSANDVLGLSGWRWMFIALGAITVGYGGVFYLLMTDNAQSAKFLNDKQKTWLAQNFETEVAESDAKVVRHKFREALKSLSLWAYTTLYFCSAFTHFGLWLWLPQLVKSQFTGLTSAQVAVLTALPFFCGMVAMLVFGHTSDKSGDRRWHLLAISVAGAVSLVLSALSQDRTTSFVLLCAAVGCTYAYMVVFWPCPMRGLKGTAAVGGIALINSVGTFGGFFGPSLFGVLKGHTGSFSIGLAMFAMFYIPMGLIPLFAPRLFAPVVVSSMAEMEAKAS